MISIHALRVEGDPATVVQTGNHPHFYPRPPGGGRLHPKTAYQLLADFYPRPPGGGRLRVIRGKQYYIRFLSTPSGWRATKKMFTGVSYQRDFYPRPPGGGRLTEQLYTAMENDISIHALRVEGDRTVVVFFARNFISIHALRVEGDVGFAADSRFSPVFLSTPSGWRATISSQIAMLQLRISIHALRVEGDSSSNFSSRLVCKDFYPRPPGGGRPARFPVSNGVD